MVTRGEAAGIAIGTAAAIAIGVAAVLSAQARPGPKTGTLTIGSSPSGVPFSLTVGGSQSSQSTPFSSTYAEGTSVSFALPLTFSLGGQQLAFQQWSDGANSPTRTATIIADGNLAFTAIYASTASTPTATTVSADLSQGVAGQNITFTGKLTRTDTNLGLPGLNITLEESADNGASWAPMVTVATANDGSYTASGSFSAPGNYLVRAHFYGA